MRNQHQSGRSPWKLKLSRRQIRAGARLFWASNHCACAEEGASLLLSPARQQPRKHQLLRAASSLLYLPQHKAELCLAGSVRVRVWSSFKRMKCRNSVFRLKEEFYLTGYSSYSLVWGSKSLLFTLQVSWVLRPRH